MRPNSDPIFLDSGSEENKLPDPHPNVRTEESGNKHRHVIIHYFTSRQDFKEERKVKNKKEKENGNGKNRKSGKKTWLSLLFLFSLDFQLYINHILHEFNTKKCNSQSVEKNK